MFHYRKLNVFHLQQCATLLVNVRDFVSSLVSWRCCQPCLHAWRCRFPAGNVYQAGKGVCVCLRSWYLHSSSIGDMPSCDPIGYCNQPVASLVRFLMNCNVSLQFTHFSCPFSSKGNEIGIVLFHIYASFLFKSRRAVFILRSMQDVKIR